MIVPTNIIFKHAYGTYACGAYNINNAEQIMGLFQGNTKSQAPFIIQISKGSRKYTDKRLLEAMIRAADEIFPEAIFSVHLDHGDEETCYECIDSGFYSSVMIDASHEEFDKNIEITHRVVERAHKRGISVEAELGMLGGVEEDISVSEDEACLTNPEEAQEFITRSGCDSLACAIGTSHGAYKFSGALGLHFEVIEKISRQLPRFPLVMHGASSVPKNEISRINSAGGNLKNTSGVPESDIHKAVVMGVTKVNIDTDGRLVWCRVHRESFSNSPENFDLRPPGKIFMEEYANYIIHKNKILRSANKLKELRKFISTSE